MNSRIIIMAILLSTVGFGQDKGTKSMAKQELEVAVLGGGCFWCVEAIFEQIEGVVNIKTGYAGGRIKDPTYEDVCRGITGHAEVIQIVYDFKVISYEKLLDVLWKAHDPTTLNRQGNDFGTQYLSLIHI